MNDTDGRLYTLRCGHCLTSWTSTEPDACVEHYRSAVHKRGCIAPLWHLTLVQHPELSQVHWVIATTVDRRR